MLRRLPKHCALVIDMDLSPVVVRVRAAWERRDFRKLNRQARRPVPLVEDLAVTEDLDGELRELTTPAKRERASSAFPFAGTLPRNDRR